VATSHSHGWGVARRPPLAEFRCDYRQPPLSFFLFFFLNNNNNLLAFYSLYIYIYIFFIKSDTCRHVIDVDVRPNESVIF
jgi:hypothetical protein